jgi:hypothetical protein
MSKMNLLIHLNAYRDTTDTNNPALNHVKWNRDLQALSVSEPTSKCVDLPSGQSLSLFSGTVSTSADGTTTWDIALAPNSSTKYRISHNGGTAPAFRTSRNEGHDATTQVTITKNAKLLTFTSTGGTAFDLITGSVQVGDEVRVGAAFNSANQGKYKILSFTATSFTVENEIGQAEGPITLGASFATEINIFSQDGVQVGDKVDILSGFSSVTFGTYDIVDVSHDYIEIYSGESLPTEAGVSNSPDAFLIYRDAKQFLFIESDKKLDIKINGSTITNEIIPMTAGTAKKPGFFMSSASIKSAEIINKDQSTATVFYVTAE